MEVSHIVIVSTVDPERVERTICIVSKVQNGRTVSLAQQFSAAVVILMLDTVDSFTGSNSVTIVGESKGSISTTCSCQFSAILPSHGPTGAVVVACGIAVGIIGDRLVIVSNELVLPVVGAVGVSMRSTILGCGKNITYVIVSVGILIPTAACCTEKLSLLVVGIGHNCLAGCRIGGNVAPDVVAVLEGLSQPRIAQAGHLIGGAVILQDTVQILLIDRTVLDCIGCGIGILAGDGAQPPQAVVAHGQHIPVRHGDGIDTAVQAVVGIILGEYRRANPPAVANQLVFAVVAAAHHQNRGTVHLLPHGNQAADGIIAVKIGGSLTIRRLRDVAELSVAVIAVTQNPAGRSNSVGGVSDSFGAAQNVIGGADGIAVGVGLGQQAAVFVFPGGAAPSGRLGIRDWVLGRSAVLVLEAYFFSAGG